MVEFALNSAISASLGFAPFKLNYGCVLHINISILPEPNMMPGVKHFIEHTQQNLADTHNAIIVSCVQQTHYANCQQHDDDTIAIGNLVYLATDDLSLPKGRAMKLLPKYIGPFKVLNMQNDTSTYKIKLPAQLCAQNLHDRFYQS